jgi:glutathione S-transferase
MFEAKSGGKAADDQFVKVMGWVNDYIKPTGYVAGTDHMTLADICFMSTFRYFLK